MDKQCIFDKKQPCNNCGDCDICELDNKKICNNCGKCLEMEGYDLRAIKIDEIFENAKDSSDYEELDKLHEEANSKLIKEDELPWDYIDDIKDISQLIEEERDIYEEYPGLINLNKNRRD